MLQLRLARRTFRTIILAAPIVLLAACDQPRAKQEAVIPEERMVELLAAHCRRMVEVDSVWKPEDCGQQLENIRRTTADDANARRAVLAIRALSHPVRLHDVLRHPEEARQMWAEFVDTYDLREEYGDFERFRNEVWLHRRPMFRFYAHLMERAGAEYDELEPFLEKLPL